MINDVIRVPTIVLRDRVQDSVDRYYSTVAVLFLFVIFWSYTGLQSA
jgi:hypothetical protein